MESIRFSLFPSVSDDCLLFVGVVIVVVVAVLQQRALHSLLCSQILSDEAEALDDDEQLDSVLKNDLEDDSLLVKQLNVVDDSEFDNDDDEVSFSTAAC